MYQQAGARWSNAMSPWDRHHASVCRTLASSVLSPMLRTTMSSRLARVMARYLARDAPGA